MYGDSALAWAAANSDIAVLNTLLAHDNLDLHTTDHNGLTPLILASRDGKEQIGRLFLERDETDVTLKQCRFARHGEGVLPNCGVTS